MKRLNIVLIALVALIAFSCGSGPSVVGEWKLSDIDPGIEIPEAQKEQFEELKKMMIDNMTITFNEDGSSISKSMNPFTQKLEEDKGTYTLSEDKKTLTLIMEEGEKPAEISELTATSLILKVEERGNTSTLSFTK